MPVGLEASPQTTDVRIAPMPMFPPDSASGEEQSRGAARKRRPRIGRVGQREGTETFDQAEKSSHVVSYLHYPQAPSSLLSPIGQDLVPFFEEPDSPGGASDAQGRVAASAERVVKQNREFAGEDKAALVERARRTASCLSSEELGSVSDEELDRRVRKVLLIEVMSGLLDDVPPEKKAAVMSAIRRRPMFDD